MLFWREYLEVRKNGKKLIPIKYFSARPNVGDELNVYLIQKISGRIPFEIRSGWLKHVLGIGSIMHFGSRRSVVWGAGVIEEKQLPRQGVLKSMRFLALRGARTRNLIGEKLGKTLDCPLGDPAVLMPLFYAPKVQKKYSVGIVPHYIDKTSPSYINLLEKMNAKFIDVGLPVEKFVDELSSCELVISSSLHGLILADAYDIPNIWVKFSDNVIGGDYKFLDYYSTTDLINPGVIDLSDKKSIQINLESLLASARVAKFVENKSHLLDAFPSRL